MAAQIMAKVKALTRHVTSLCKRKVKCSERIDQMLTHMENVETQISELESVLAEGTKTCGRRLSGGRSVALANEHPLLKVYCDTMSPMLSVLNTSAYGAHNVFSDVWSRGVYVIVH
jgi:hypothetical protein